MIGKAYEFTDGSEEARLNVYYAGDEIGIDMEPSNIPRLEAMSEGYVVSMPIPEVEALIQVLQAMVENIKAAGWILE